MKLQSLINDIHPTLPSTTEKSASAATASAAPASSATPSGGVGEAMRGVVAAIGSPKTASDAGTPVVDVLVKEAEAIERATGERVVRLSKLASNAFVEETIAGFNRAAEAADRLTKEAAEKLDPETIRLAKLAQDNPEAFLREVEHGARERRAASGQAKLAAEQKLAHYQKLAAAHYLNGYESLRQATAA